MQPGECKPIWVNHGSLPHATIPSVHYPGVLLPPAASSLVLVCLGFHLRREKACDEEKCKSTLFLVSFETESFSSTLPYTILTEGGKVEQRDSWPGIVMVGGVVDDLDAQKVWGGWLQVGEIH